MTKKLKRRMILLCVTLSLFLMNGCTKQNKETGSSQFNESITSQYHKENVSLVNAASCDPRDIYLSPNGDAIYCRSLKENGSEFYRMDMAENSEPEKVMGIYDETIFSWDISAGDKADDVLSVFAYSEDKTHLLEYNSKGKMQRDILLKDPDVYRIYAFSHWKLGDGKFLAAGHQQLLLFDDQGESLGLIDCPGKSFQGGILTDDGNFYISFLDKDDKCRLAKVDLQEKAIKKSFEIPGAGAVFCENEEGKIFVMDADYIYQIDVSSQDWIRLLKFDSFRGLVSSRIASMKSKEQEFLLLSWDPLNPEKYLDLVMLLPEGMEETAIQNTEAGGKFDASGRQIVTLYDPSNITRYFFSASIIDGFNADNEEYVIQIDNSQPDVNTKLADQDSPDLMLLFSDALLENYVERGYLEDLLPYFKKSKVVPDTELTETMINSYGFNGGLYSVCVNDCIVSIYGLESEVGSKEGWTVDEFLQWFESNSNIATINEIPKWALLDYCLRGNMQRYITDDGKAHFEDEIFRNLIKRIKDLEYNISASDRYLYEQKKEENQALLGCMYMQNVSELAKTEAFYGEKFVRKGFPNDDGKPVSTLFGFGNLCMLQNSSCKEGAFEFLEYLLIDPWYSMEHYTAPTVRYEAKGTLYTIKKLLNREMKIALGEHRAWIPDEDGNAHERHYEITEDQEERILRAWREALPDTYDNQKIRNLVMEEAQAYFAGQKDLDETCRVIQNRVQLFLNERK